MAVLKLVLSIVVVFSASCIISGTGFSNFGACKTPSNTTGVCLRIGDCEPFVSILSRGNLSSDDMENVKKSQCGIDSTQSKPQRKVLICCPDKFVNDSRSISDELDQPGNVLPVAGVCGKFLKMRIYGGRNTSIDEYPWMALIQYKNTSSNVIGFHCGGSLINSRYVLTAAHCVVKQNIEIPLVRLGEWDLRTQNDCEEDIRGPKWKFCAPAHQDIKVERVIAHDQFEADSPNLYNDIALLRLERNVIYSQFVKPICLPIAPELRNKKFLDSPMDVAGWGKTENLTTSPIKLAVTVDVWKIKDCQNVYTDHKKVLDETKQICAGGVEGQDACVGDSGGPLMTLERLGDKRVYFVAGIVSYGPSPCGLISFPGVYTYVGSYIDWIQNQLEP